jgi:hypothetical protein
MADPVLAMALTVLEETAQWDIYRECADVRHFVADVRSRLGGHAERKTIDARLQALDAALRALADDYEQLLGDGVTETNEPAVLKQARALLSPAPPVAPLRRQQQLDAALRDIRTAFLALRVAEMETYGGEVVFAGRCATEQNALRTAIASAIETLR